MKSRQQNGPPPSQWRPSFRFNRAATRGDRLIVARRRDSYSRPLDATRHQLLVHYMFSEMAAANASARGQRAAILASPLSELSGFCLVVDCLAPDCAGERTFAMSDLAGFYGAGRLASTAPPRDRDRVGGHPV
jgi:hypothetical protein